MIKYFQKGYNEAKRYSKHSNKKFYPICPDCGRIRENPSIISDVCRSETISCFCSDNNRYPNKFAFKMLEEFDINFETEYSPEWCKYIFKKGTKQGIYDFYFNINNREYILEMDGEFHNKDNKMSGQTKEDSQFMDSEKDRLANEHGIEIIRIDCDYDSVENRFKYIKNNILNNEKLNKLFDLSRIDWNKCNEYATSNLVKIACEYKKLNPDMTATQIGLLMKKALCTIISWLKIGNELEWCHYDVEEEKKKAIINSTIRIKERSSKQVEIFKNGVSLGIFESGTELARKSEKLFGIKLIQTMISKVCLGKQKEYKGYTFKYV